MALPPDEEPRTVVDPFPAPCAGPRRNERELSSRSAEVLAELEARAAGGEELSDVARRFFAQWGRSNGVIARCLPDDQRAFLAWTASP